MRIYDVTSIREHFSTLSTRANESLGCFGSCSLGIGRYVPGKSPWERHNNGDELLYVTDGHVSVEILENDGTPTTCEIGEGQLFVVPQGRWHQLTANAPVNILFVSPAEDGAERTREHPFGNA